LDKTRLVGVNNVRNSSFQSVGHDFGEQLHRVVLKGYRLKAVRSAHTLMFREENEMNLVQTIQINNSRMKVVENLHDKGV
jgi:hypothetical protein